MIRNVFNCVFFVVVADCSGFKPKVVWYAMVNDSVLEWDLTQRKNEEKKSISTQINME